MATLYLILADIITVFHLGYIAFVVVGQLLIWIGWAARWKWVRNPTFRLLHFLAIAFVAFEGVIDMKCPLTVWEDQLREAAGQVPGEETFMARLVHQVLFIPEDVVSEDTLQYSYMIVAAIVLITLVLFPPRRFGKKSESPARLSTESPSPANSELPVPAATTLAAPEPLPLAATTTNPFATNQPETPNARDTASKSTTG